MLLSLCDPALADDCHSYPVTVRGESLAPLLHDGASIMMKPASCAGAVRRGDLVIFHTGARDLPVIKIAKALPGDGFAVAKDGMLSVNDKAVHNSAGQPYILPSSNRALLEAYQQNFRGILPAGTYLLLSDGANGVIDSTRIGLVHHSDFIMVEDKP